MYRVSRRYLSFYLFHIENITFFVRIIVICRFQFCSTCSRDAGTSSRTRATPSSSSTKPTWRRMWIWEKQGTLLYWGFFRVITKNHRKEVSDSSITNSPNEFKSFNLWTVSFILNVLRVVKYFHRRYVIFVVFIMYPSICLSCLLLLHA